MRTYVRFTRPRDKSLQAYQDWIRETVIALGGKLGNDMTPEEWEARWREFWSDDPTVSDEEDLPEDEP